MKINVVSTQIGCEHVGLMRINQMKLLAPTRPLPLVHDNVWLTNQRLVVEAWWAGALSDHLLEQHLLPSFDPHRLEVSFHELLRWLEYHLRNLV
jgi:hypothetical protein